MKLSKEASHLIDECYDKKNNPMAYTITIGEKFTIGNNEDKKYKITDELVEELRSTGKVNVVVNGKQVYMISGKKGGLIHE